MLSLLYQHKDKVEMEIWVTNKVNDNVVSLTKFFNPTRPDLPKLLTNEELAPPMYYIDNNNRVFIRCDEYLEDDDKMNI